MEIKCSVVILSIFLSIVLGCDPLGAVPLWNSTVFWEDILGKTNQNGQGLVLYEDDDANSLLRHIYLSGASDWADNLTESSSSIMLNDIIYMGTLGATTKPILKRVDANTGKILSNLSITVQSSSPGYLVVRLACDNVLYSLYGDIFYSLVANDASTGAWLWQTDEGISYSTLVISEDCKYVTFVMDPLDNKLNYTLIQLDAKTGLGVWKTPLAKPRLQYINWEWGVYGSSVANRIAVVAYNHYGIYYNAYTFQLFDSKSGMMTFEKDFPITAGIALINSPITFSKDGSLAIFSPLEINGIKISGNKDALVWSTTETDGVVFIGPYFSSTSKTALFSLWNYGNTKFIALNTMDGSTVWVSSWYQFVVTVFSDFGDRLFALTGHALYEVDIKKCNLP